MTVQLLALCIAAAWALALAGPWWTPRRVRARVLAARTARRGRHRFALPPVDPERLEVLGWRPYGRTLVHRPDAEGRGGWFGRTDAFGRVHVDRWLAPPGNV